jgi:hypothetical protein
MPLHKNATTALCTKPRPPILLAVAPCLLASKFTVMAGAQLGPRKLKFRLFQSTPQKASTRWLFLFQPSSQWFC